MQVGHKHRKSEDIVKVETEFGTCLRKKKKVGADEGNIAYFSKYVEKFLFT